VVVYCPESREVAATQEPLRPTLHPVATTPPAAALPTVPTFPAPAAIIADPPAPAMDAPAPSEQHFTIRYGDTGYSYEAILGLYLPGAREVVVEDPYIRLPHQVQNFVRFCEAVVKVGAARRIKLVTSYDADTPLADVQERLAELRQSLLEMDVALDVELSPTLHDREIRLDNGWVIKIGRGLDFYQKPASWHEIGVHDLALRKCLETKVDIYRG